MSAATQDAATQDQDSFRQARRTRGVPACFLDEARADGFQAADPCGIPAGCFGFVPPSRCGNGLVSPHRDPGPRGSLDFGDPSDRTSRASSQAIINHDRGIDMETATLFIVGFADRVPKGARFLVSDNPMTEEGDKRAESDRTVTARLVVWRRAIGIDAPRDLRDSGQRAKLLRPEGTRALRSARASGPARGRACDRR